MPPLILNGLLWDQVDSAQLAHSINEDILNIKQITHINMIINVYLQIQIFDNNHPRIHVKKGPSNPGLNS